MCMPPLKYYNIIIIRTMLTVSSRHQDLVLIQNLKVFESGAYHSAHAEHVRMLLRHPELYRFHLLDKSAEMAFHTIIVGNRFS